MTNSQFKRLEIGTQFTSTSNGTNGQRFRKVSKSGAYRVLPSGRGQTHAQVKFSRSAAVAC